MVRMKPRTSPYALSKSQSASLSLGAGVDFDPIYDIMSSQHIDYVDFPISAGKESVDFDLDPYGIEYMLYTHINMLHC